MKNYVQRGDTLTFTTPITVDSGEIVKMGEILGIAANDAELGESLDVTVTGVFDLSKVAADEFAVGDPVYYDEAENLVTSEPTENPRIGVATTVAAAASGFVNVRLSAQF